MKLLIEVNSSDKLHCRECVENRQRLNSELNSEEDSAEPDDLFERACRLASSSTQKLTFCSF